MSVEVAVLLANAAATWVMCGVIWFVQLVHYPMFARLSRDAFRPAMLDHQAGTGRVVFGPMLVELVTSLVLIALRPASALAWVGAVLVGVWGFSTVLVQVPLHNRLAEGGFDAAVHHRLVRSNWVRTAAWTARTVLCLWLLAGR
jgi:hypothetical protein